MKQRHRYPITRLGMCALAIAAFCVLAMQQEAGVIASPVDGTAGTSAAAVATTTLGHVAVAQNRGGSGKGGGARGGGGGGGRSGGARAGAGGGGGRSGSARASSGGGGRSAPAGGGSVRSGGGKIGAARPPSSGSRGNVSTPRSSGGRANVAPPRSSGRSNAGQASVSRGNPGSSGRSAISRAPSRPNSSASSNRASQRSAQSISPAQRNGSGNVRANPARTLPSGRQAARPDSRSSARDINRQSAARQAPRASDDRAMRSTRDLNARQPVSGQPGSAGRDALKTGARAGDSSAGARDRTRQLPDNRRRTMTRDAVSAGQSVSNGSRSAADSPSATSGLARGSGLSRNLDRSDSPRGDGTARSGLASGTRSSSNSSANRTRAFGELNSSAEISVNDSSNVTINNINKIKNKNVTKTRNINKSSSKSGHHDGDHHGDHDDHWDDDWDGHHGGDCFDDDFVFALSIGGSWSSCSPWFAPHWGWSGWCPPSYCNWFSSDLCWFDDDFSICVGVSSWPVASCSSWNSWCFDSRPFCHVCGSACFFPSLHFVSSWPSWYGGGYYSSSYSGTYYEPQPYPYEPLPAYGTPDQAAPVPLVSIDEAWNLLMAGSFAEAQDGFMGLVIAGLDAGEARVGYAIASALQGKTDAAVTAMRRALREDPGAIRAVPSSAALDDRIRAAMEVFAARVRTTPADVDALFMVASMRYLLGDDAVAYFAIDAAMQHGDLDPSTANLAKVLEEGMKSRLYEPAP